MVCRSKIGVAAHNLPDAPHRPQSSLSCWVCVLGRYLLCLSTRASIKDTLLMLSSLQIERGAVPLQLRLDTRHASPQKAKQSNRCGHHGEHEVHRVNWWNMVERCLDADQRNHEKRFAPSTQPCHKYIKVGGTTESADSDLHRACSDKADVGDDLPVHVGLGVHGRTEKAYRKIKTCKKVGSHAFNRAGTFAAARSKNRSLASPQPFFCVA